MQLNSSKLTTNVIPENNGHHLREYPVAYGLVGDLRRGKQMAWLPVWPQLSFPNYAEHVSITLWPVKHSKHARPWGSWLGTLQSPSHYCAMLRSPSGRINGGEWSEDSKWRFSRCHALPQPSWKLLLYAKHVAFWSMLNLAAVSPLAVPPKQQDNNTSRMRTVKGDRTHSSPEPVGHKEAECFQGKNRELHAIQQTSYSEVTSR